MRRILQLPTKELRFALAIWVLILVVSFAQYLENPDPQLRHRAILYTARGTVGFWGYGSFRLLLLMRRSWARQRSRIDEQWVWALGFALFVCHIVAAFHLAHNWSHERAFRQTELESGFGEGIFVNYFFGLIWFSDVVWLSFCPRSYARRPSWVSGCIHGFLAFIMFNATVIFGSTAARVVGVLSFTAILFGFFLRFLASHKRPLQDFDPRIP